MKKDNMIFNLAKNTYSQIYNSNDKMILIDETLSHVPILWDGVEGNYDEFEAVAQDLGMNYILFVKNDAGKNICVWAVSEIDLNNIIQNVSNDNYFLNVRSLYDQKITFGF